VRERLSAVRARSSRGYSLIDMLVALAVGGTMLAATVTLLHLGLRSWAWGAARVEAQQSARYALERMASELREAGYDPTAAGIAPVVVAEPARVAFQRDFDGDGVVDPTRERVTYLLRPKETTLRRDAGGGAQPLAENVRRFALSYLDSSGAPTADPARIASIRMEIEAGRIETEATMATLVTLRNGPIW